MSTGTRQLGHIDAARLISPFACMCIPEQRILGWMMKGMIERGAGLDLTGLVGFDGHEVNHQAIIDGELLLYAEYTGTALRRYLRRTAGTNPEQVYRIVRNESKRRWNLAWLSRFGFNNTYALLMQASRARELGIKLISHVARHAPHLTLVAPQEFLKSESKLRFAVGGYPRFVNTYGFKFRRALAVDSQTGFSMMQSGEADMAIGFATDFRVICCGLVDLHDDRQFFSPYEMAPVVRGDFLAEHSQVGTLLEGLTGKIDNLTMARLNYRVVVEQREATHVANEFLRRSVLGARRAA